MSRPLCLLSPWRYPRCGCVHACVRSCVRLCVLCLGCSWRIRSSAEKAWSSGRRRVACLSLARSLSSPCARSDHCSNLVEIDLRKCVVRQSQYVQARRRCLLLETLVGQHVERRSFGAFSTIAVMRAHAPGRWRLKLWQPAWTIVARARCDCLVLRFFVSSCHAM